MLYTSGYTNEPKIFYCPAADPQTAIGDVSGWDRVNFNCFVSYVPWANYQPNTAWGVFIRTASGYMFWDPESIAQNAASSSSSVIASDFMNTGAGSSAGWCNHFDEKDHLMALNDNLFPPAWPARSETGFAPAAGTC